MNEYNEEQYEVEIRDLLDTIDNFLDNLGEDNPYFKLNAVRRILYVSARLGTDSSYEAAGILETVKFDIIKEEDEDCICDDCRAAEERDVKSPYTC